jgi:hypothetical protein
LRPLCVAPADADAAASAILDLASSYDAYRVAFAANARRLRHRHARGAEALNALLETAVVA